MHETSTPAWGPVRVDTDIEAFEQQDTVFTIEEATLPDLLAMVINIFARVGADTRQEIILFDAEGNRDGCYAQFLVRPKTA